MFKVHLDTDLGGDIDDLCALVFLLKSSEVELTGITVNSDMGGKRTGYVRYVLKLAGRENIPVADGVEVSREFYRYPELGLPDEKKYWPEPVQPSFNPPEKATELLKQSLEQEAIIIGIGTFTNLYFLETKYPGVLKNARIFIDGGFVYPPRPGFPDWKSDFDWNVQTDTRSAKYIFENSSPVLVPVSVSAETALRKVDLEKLASGDALARLIARQANSFVEDERIAEKYRNCINVPRDIVNFHYDPLVAAVATGYNQGVKIEKIPLVFQEENGWLFEKIDNTGKLTKVVTRIDGENFNRFWLGRVLGN